MGLRKYLDKNARLHTGSKESFMVIFTPSLARILLHTIVIEIIHALIISGSY